MASDDAQLGDRDVGALIGALAVGMSVTAPDGRLVAVNPALADFLGTSVEELRGSTRQELTSADDLSAEQELMRQVIAGERDSYRLLTHAIHPDGSRRTGDLTVSAVRDEDGTLRYLVGQVIDVTDHDRTLATLEATLASMLDPHVVVKPELDASGAVRDARFLVVNDAAGAYLGAPPDRLTGTRLRDLGSGPSVDLVLDWVSRAVADGEPMTLDDELLPTQQGDERWVDLRVVPMPDAVSVTWRDVSARHHAAVDRAERESRYRLLADNATDVIVQSDEHGYVTWVSPSVTEALGWTPEELVGDRLAHFVHPDDLPAVRQARRSAVSDSGSEGRITARFRTAHGGWRWMSDHGRAIVDEHGGLIGGIDSLRDVQAERDAEEALRLREQELRAVVDTLADPWVLLTAVRDREGRLVDFVYSDANEAACAVNRVPRDLLLGRRLLELLPEHGPSGVFDRYAAVVETGEPLAEDDQPFTSPADGTLRRFDNRAVKVGDGISLTWRDVTERYEARQRLRHLADHDLLTGAANRRLLEARMAEVLSRQPRTGSRVAVLFCDLDHFKQINDSLGHTAGDRVLSAVASAASAAVREGDLVARIGGDEFVVILDGVRDLADAGAVAAKVAHAAGHPVEVEGQRVEPRLSIGVALAEPGENAEAVLARADAALYSAKTAGRGRIGLDGGGEPIVVG